MTNRLTLKHRIEALMARFTDEANPDLLQFMSIYRQGERGIIDDGALYELPENNVPDIVQKDNAGWDYLK